MSSLALTAKYRPQTFAEVAGQDAVKAILSRAALEDRAAPAYLFSGTRGVGKTTLARVFAKALNCRQGPAAEPCNRCDLCRAVIQGNAVDVAEIDGASNRGIDDVRRLRESVGYAPMDGRHKIFIIDEAHMLSREAFNALLKTLEEPPPRVVFILATTEPHKFPATVLSRCQHFVFKRLTEKAIRDHLVSVLEREGLGFDEAAARLLARRGDGSVRDAMSLLAQVLALGEGRLTEETVRAVLGLAGRDALCRMLAAVRDGDCLTLTRLARDLLDQGLDLGFFLRELTSLWRDLFILRQTGRDGLSAAESPEGEAQVLLELAGAFSLAHIHACWQMTLEGQRRVLTSQAPALALELLLLNLALLPRLLPLESLSVRGERSPSVARNASPAASVRAAVERPVPAGPEPAPATAVAAQAAKPTAAQAEETPPVPDPVAAQAAEPAMTPVPEATAASDTVAAPVEEAPADPAEETPPVSTTGPVAAQAGEPAPEPTAAPAEEAPPAPATDPVAAQAAAPAAGSARTSRPDWPSILQACADQNAPTWLLPLLRKVTARWREGRLCLIPADPFTAQRLQDSAARDFLRAALAALCPPPPPVDIDPPTRVETSRQSREELRRELSRHPLIQELERNFGARIIDCGRLR
jgi:DNA polymerase-3 subunit gamma/tau